MHTSLSLTTDRLLVTPLSVSDDSFIFELLNTEGWIKFIGNRNITSEAAAAAYIEKTLANKDISYWVVKLRDNDVKIGIVTYIKRHYLEHRDIGFAFLPQFNNKGYAYEAANAVLQALIREQAFTHIVATTLPDNAGSIRLLEKMGLVFEKKLRLKTKRCTCTELQTTS